MQILMILAMVMSLFGMAMPVAAQLANSVNIDLIVEPTEVCADGTLYYTVVIKNDPIDGAHNAWVDLVFYPPGPAGGATSLGAPVELATDLYLVVGEIVTFTWVGGGGDLENAGLEVDLGAIPLDPCVTLAYGEAEFYAEFDWTPPYTGDGGKDIPAIILYPCISGYKYDDCTGLGLEGWTIELYDGAGGFIDSTTTDVDGFYSFCGLCLMPGDYQVCEVVEPGWMAVGPTCIDVTLDCEDVTDVNFTNTPLLCISGYKIDDCTGWGVEGWTINLYYVGGALIGSTTTDVDGFYSFCDLEPGDYEVCEEVEDGWMAASDECVPVTLDCQDATDVNFYNTPLLCISGYKIDDCTGEGLEGWTINLYAGQDSGALIDSTTTDVDGFYSFCDLAPGDYEVCETLQAGWTNVTPLCISVTLECADSTGNDFRNTPVGNEGCTPGFWKNNAKNWGASAWVGYAPGDYFEVIFGVDVTLRGQGKTTYPTPTLLEALDANGGGINALARHAVAALLNIANPDIGYGISSTAALITMVHDAIESGDEAQIEALHMLLAEYNEAGCPINQMGEPIMDGMVF